MGVENHFMFNNPPLNKEKNPFLLLGVPESYQVKEEEIEQAYWRLQSHWHPDRFIKAPLEKKLEAQAMCVRINHAYKTLKDPISRARFFCEKYIPQSVDSYVKEFPSLLETIFQWREEVFEANQNTTHDFLKLFLERQEIFSNAIEKQNLNQLKESYVWLLYLHKILVDLGKF